MEINKDGNGNPYIQCEQVPNIWKRAWVRHATGEKDWASTGRYINVVRCHNDRNPAGNSTDFPIFNDLTEEQVLVAFVHSVNAITGCKNV